MKAVTPTGITNMILYLNYLYREHQITQHLMLTAPRLISESSSKTRTQSIWPRCIAIWRAKNLLIQFINFQSVDYFIIL